MEVQVAQEGMHPVLELLWDILVAYGMYCLRYASVSADDRQALQDSIAVLLAVSIAMYNRQEQQAYWINLYNALTVSVILAHDPVASSRDSRLSGLFSSWPLASHTLDHRR